jgi:hypothetical protein
MARGGKNHYHARVRAWSLPRPASMALFLILPVSIEAVGAPAAASLLTRADEHLRKAERSLDALSGCAGNLDDCAAARAEAVAALLLAGRLLPEAALEPGLPSRLKTLERLTRRRKTLEAALLAARDGSGRSSPGAPSSYEGRWTFFNTPLTKTGCCGKNGPDSTLSVEQNRGPIWIDGRGRFLALVHEATILGAVDPLTGRLTATMTDPLCGQGTLAGRCRGFAACAGSYSQASGGEGSEAGSFRLSR